MAGAILEYARRLLGQDNSTDAGATTAPLPNDDAVQASPPPAEEPIVDAKLKILNDGWGHRGSRETRRTIDAAGEPLPWYTYPAIEYLRQLDFSRARVFEWGSGGSSLYWGARCKELVSVERNREWFERVSEAAPSNVTVIHVEDDPDYANEITRHGLFDVIVIDGEQRRNCAAAALHHWASGGLIILDNSDWYTLAATYLRKQGLVQVDLSGFGPINDYTWSTSVFFRGEFKFEPRAERLPMHGVGALQNFAAEDEQHDEE